MKSLWIYLLLFLLFLSPNFTPILAYSQILDGSLSSEKSLTLFETPEWKFSLSQSVVPQQGLTIIALSNGTIYLCEGNSGKVLWSSSVGSSLSSVYQASPDGDNKEDTYPLDGGIVPYPHDNFVVDIGDGFMQTEDFYQLDLLKIVEEYVASTSLVSNDEIKIVVNKNIVKVVDAKTGSTIGEFDSNALPSQEKNESFKSNTMERIYVEIKFITLNSYDRISGKLLWNLVVSGIKASIFPQGQGVPLHVIQVPDISHVRFLFKNLLLNRTQRERHTTEALARYSENSTAVAIFDSTKKLSSTAALAENSDPYATAVAIFYDTKKLFDDDRKFDLHTIANLVILLFLAVLLVCGTLYIVERKKSTMQLNDSRVKKTTVPKRKKARKLGGHRTIANSGKIDDIISPEGENLKGYPVNMKDDKKSRFQLGIRDDCSSKGRTVGKLFISNIEIAKGSNGTVVFEGRCDGRPVAVKRLVQAHHDVAYKEIQNLIASDRHPNIVRWHGVEWDSDFVYISLERCTCSLNDLIQISSNSSGASLLTKDKSVNSSDEYTVQLDSVKEILKDVELWKANGHPSTQLLKIMREVVSGVAHLHELGIIHRDLKPQNILITKEKSLCAKLSDMGISKRLVGDNSSLGHHPTGYGSSGWQAPEQLLRGRQTRAVDLFSLGCVLFFCITGGKHPFGDHLERDMNIVKNQIDLFIVEHIPEAVDLLTRLLDPDPESRPSALNVMNHPLFWSSETRLSFLRDASDRVELEDRENDSGILKALENVAPTALGGNWDTKMEVAFITNIGHYRRYKFDSVRDLLRVMRNKLNHYRELPKEIQEILGPVPDGFNGYFADRFPRFLIEVYRIIYMYCKEEECLLKYFNRGSL